MLTTILVLIIVAQELFHYFERRDLYNRMMSKNLTEYRQQGKPMEHIPSAHDRVLQKWRKKEGDIG